MNAPSINEIDLHIERGGPAYRLMTWVGLIREGDPSVARRIIAFLAITTVPLLLLAWWEGVLLGPTPRESLLLDFAAFARFFIAIPLLFVAELSIGPRVTGAGLHFVRAGLVSPEDLPRFERAVRRLVKWRNSPWMELAILAIALVGAWTFTAETVSGVGAKSWTSITVDTETGQRLSLVGLWFRVVAVPLIQFFWYRWVWRYLLWVRFLFDMSSLRLNLVPTHADGAGGLGFLGTAHTSFGILSFAVCSILSASVAMLIVFEGASIQSFQVHFITLVVIAELLFLGPLAMFTPMMMRARLDGLRQYNLLVLQYNRAFHKKWIDGQAGDDPSLLGSSDIQSLADLGSSYEYIREMKALPFGVRVILQLAVVTLLPAVPLLLLVMPVEEILSLMSKAVL
jgi:hypothetical protein